MKSTLATLQSLALGIVTLALVASQPVAAQGTTAKQQSQATTEKTLTGVISDSMCGTTHMAKDKSPAECTRMCVKQGQKFALVVGKKVYTLEGHEAELDKLAGQRVAVKGTVSGDTVSVSAVTPAKKKATP